MNTPLHVKNFQTLCRAFQANDVMLVEITCHKTGQIGAYICAVNHLENGKTECVPFAKLLDELLEPMAMPPTSADNTAPWQNN